MIVVAEYSEQGTRPSPYCGRIDEHEPHEHTTHEFETWRRTTLLCPGTPVTEGGQKA